MTRRIAFGTAVILAGILFAVLAIFLYPDPVDGDPESIQAALAATTTPPTTAPSTTTTSTEMPEPAWQRFVVDADTVPDNAGASPVGLRIERIGVDAPIEPYGVDTRNGEMDVPRNVKDVAWYKHGPIPGETGSAVLAAHVDLSGQGKGVFFNLKTLSEGDEIYVNFDNGEEAGFRVSARTIYTKDNLPIDAIFSRTGPAVLTLITCGGGFNESVGSYDSNVVVYAIAIDDVELEGNPPIN
jgi:LPXTG-site transpeptidase (sortase) family protein